MGDKGNSWNIISNSLLEKNHIKIPIEKRFFLCFLHNEDDTSIQKKKIITDLESMGFTEKDPRLQKFFNKIKGFVVGNSLQYEEFKYCIENHLYI